MYRIKLILFYQYSRSQSIIAYPYECLLNNDFRYSIEVFTFDSINNYFGDTEILICNNETNIVINELMIDTINNIYWVEFILLS